MKKLQLLLCSMLAAVMLLSCERNEGDIEKLSEDLASESSYSTVSSDPIKLSVDLNDSKISGYLSGVGDETKAVYNTTNNLQINWEPTDRVLVVSPEAHDIKSSEYTVYPVLDAKAGRLEPADPSRLLLWGGNIEHNIYSAYPYDKSSISEDGVYTFRDYTTQTLKRLSGNVYSPDMTSAFMASVPVTTQPDIFGVHLDFNPVMTTLDVEVGMCDDAEIISLEVIMKNSEGYLSPDGTFSIRLDNGNITLTGANTANVGDVKIKADLDTPLSILSGEKAILTVLLPPLSIGKTEPLTVIANVRMNGVDKDYSVVCTTPIVPRTRTKVSILPPIKLNIRPISVLFSTVIDSLKSNRPLSYVVTSNDEILDNDKIKDIRWELDYQKGGTFVNLSDNTSQTPDLLYNIQQANEHDYAELILSGTDDFGRRCADTISVLVGDLPAWRFADYNYGTNSHNYNQSYFYRASAIYNKTEQRNGLTYHCPTTTECWGIVMYRNFNQTSFFQESTEGVDNEEYVTYGPVNKQQYTGSYWSVVRSAPISLGTKGTVSHDCYGIKLYTATDYQHACAYRYRYKWDAELIGLYCEVKAFYVGRYAKYFLSSKNRTELQGLIESTPYPNEVRILIFPAWGVHQYWVGISTHKWIERNEHADYWLKRDITVKPLPGWAVDVMSFRQDKPCLDERLNASGGYHPWSTDNEVYHYQPVRFVR